MRARRRREAHRGRPPAVREFAIALALAALLAGWTLAVLLAHKDRPDVLVQLPGLARAAAAVLFVASAAMQLVRAKLIGDRRSGWAAAGLLVIGSELPLVGILSALVMPGARPSDATVSTRLLVVIPVLVIAVLAASSSAQSRANAVRPLRLASVVICGCLLGGAALAEGRSMGIVPGTGSAFWTLTELAAALAWLAVGALVCWQARAGDCATLRWISAGMVLMSASEALRAWATTGPGTPAAVAAAVQLDVAVIAAMLAARGLRRALAIHGSRTLALADGVDELSGRLHLVEQREQERLHDARSALTGVLGATRLIANWGVFDGESARTMHAMMTAELLRISRLLDGEASLSDFDLGVALTPVVAAHRLAGLPVEANLTSVRAHGSAHATATAVSNLLANCAQHAPGAAVHVWMVADHDAGTVLVHVTDTGPGIPAAERDQVVRMGVRGSSAGPAGSGIGLCSAARALAAQGGALRIDDSAGGGTHVTVTLAAAREDSLALAVAG
jgi:two-component system OmpR family sensor kinase